MTTPPTAAAQAVMDAYKAGGLDAALIAAVKHVAPPERNPHGYTSEREEDVRAAVGELLGELLALAAELRQERRPTDEDLYDLADVFNGDPVPAMRRALELWARPTIEPVPVAERLPEPEDCDAEERCWWFRPADFSDDVSVPSWHLDASPGPGQVRFYGYTHWHPHNALPIPTP